MTSRIRIVHQVVLSVALVACVVVAANGISYAEKTAQTQYDAKPIGLTLGKPVSAHCKPVSGAQKPVSGPQKPVSGVLKPVSGAVKPVSHTVHPPVKLSR